MWAIVEGAIPNLLKGLLVTLRMAAGGLGIGLLLGLLLAVARMYGGRAVAGLAVLYGRIVRSVPLVALLLMIWLLVQEIAPLSAVASVIVALGMHSAAYQAELFRTAIGAVSTGQVKAGRTLGMTNAQVFMFIILPQAVRNAIPPWSNEVAIVLKETSLGYAVGATEMLRQANYIAARTHRPLLLYTLTGLIYLCLVYGAVRVLGYVEKKYAIPTAAERAKTRAGARVHYQY